MTVAAKPKPKTKKKMPAKLCSARKRDGSPCKNSPMRDRDICSAHAHLAGRKTLLNAETIEKFINGLASGVGIGDAAAYAGISRSTAHAWLDRAEKEQSVGTSPDQSEFVAFLDRVTRTRATVRVQLAATLRTASRDVEAAGDWRAAAWMLERLAPADFGPNKIIHEHTHEGTVSMELLDGRQPVEVSRQTREKIVVLLDAELPIDSTAEEIVP